MLWSYQLVIILISVRAFRDILQLRTQYYRSEQNRLQLEVDFLKTQVNPHFLFNTLNSVYARIFEADEQAANLVLHLSELMRYNLYETDQPRIGLDKELAYIQNYLDLERNRLSGQDVLIDYEQSGEPGVHQIAPLLLIAFVENAFRHGVKGATQPAYVQVRADVDASGQLVFTVENSLPSQSVPDVLDRRKSGGSGITNVRQRLDTLYSDYCLTSHDDRLTHSMSLSIQLNAPSPQEETKKIYPHPTPTEKRSETKFYHPRFSENLINKYRTILKHSLNWLLYFILIRYFVFSGFGLKDKTTLDILAVSIFIEAILLYYWFSSYILPSSLYRKKTAIFFFWLSAAHIVIYELNYFTMYFANKSTNNEVAGKLWNIFEKGGLSGFITNKTAATASFSWTFFFAGIVLAIKAFRDILQLRTQYYRSEQNRLQLEVDFLKTQVNPHFLFNTLNSVYARIFEADEQAANLVLHLSELMRYNLYETDQPRIGLDRELAYIQNYLDLEQNRLAGQDVLIDYEQRGEPGAYQIAPLLLIAFVENAFKHGVKGISQPAYVQVRAEVDPTGQFIFVVENSLPSRQLVTVGEVRSGGVGLTNVRRRLETLYAGQYALTTRADETTYTVTLTVNLNQSH